LRRRDRRGDRAIAGGSAIEASRSSQDFTGRSPRDRGTLRARAGRPGAAGDRARRWQPQAAPGGRLAERKPRRQIDPGPLRGPDARYRLGTGPPDRRPGRTRHPHPRHRHHAVRRGHGPVLRRAGHAARRVRPRPGDRPLDHGPAGRREHRDRRRPGGPAPAGGRTARAAGPRHSRARAPRLSAAPRAGPAVPRRVGQRLVPLGLRRCRPHHGRGLRRRARPGRHLDGRRTVVRLHRHQPGLCRTDPRHAVTECLPPGPRKTLPPG